MPPATNEEQFRFLISCIRWSNNGRVDFQEVANECNVVSKGAAAKRYERMMKAHGINPTGGPNPGIPPPAPSTPRRESKVPNGRQPKVPRFAGPTPTKKVKGKKGQEGKGGGKKMGDDWGMDCDDEEGEDMDDEGLKVKNEHMSSDRGDSQAESGGGREADLGMQMDGACDVKTEFDRGIGMLTPEPETVTAASTSDASERGDDPIARSNPGTPNQMGGGNSIFGPNAPMVSENGIGFRSSTPTPMQHFSVPQQPLPGQQGRAYMPNMGSHMINNSGGGGMGYDGASDNHSSMHGHMGYLPTYGFRTFHNPYTSSGSMYGGMNGMGNGGYASGGALNTGTATGGFDFNAYTPRTYISNLSFGGGAAQMQPIQGQMVKEMGGGDGAADNGAGGQMGGSNVMTE